MPFDPELIAPAVDRYRRERDRYIKLADRIAEMCRSDICQENAIRAQVTFRVKSTSSFEGKLRRFQRKENKSYKDVDEIFREISDFAGVRIAAYRQEDIPTVVAAVREVFSGLAGGDVEIDEKDRQKDDPANFYIATHAQVALPEDELIGTYDNLDDVTCEIQICTMMAHVWNEVEHDIGYKPDGNGPSDRERALLTALGHNVRQGDLTISLLLEANDSRAHGPEGDLRDVHDFVARFRPQYELPDFAKNSGQLFDQLVDLGLLDPEALAEVLERTEMTTARANLDTFNEMLASKDANRLQLDPLTSDVLLVQLFEQKLDEVIDSHKGRVGRGRGRPSRLYRLARHYRDFRNARQG